MSSTTRTKLYIPQKHYGGKYEFNLDDLTLHNSDRQHNCWREIHLTRERLSNGILEPSSVMAWAFTSLNELRLKRSIHFQTICNLHSGNRHHAWYKQAWNRSCKEKAKTVEHYSHQWWLNKLLHLSRASQSRQSVMKLCKESSSPLAM